MNAVGNLPSHLPSGLRLPEALSRQGGYTQLASAGARHQLHQANSSLQGGSQKKFQAPSSQPPAESAARPLMSHFSQGQPAGLPTYNPGSWAMQSSSPAHSASASALTGRLSMGNSPAGKNTGASFDASGKSGQGAFPHANLRAVPSHSLGRPLYGSPPTMPSLQFPANPGSGSASPPHTGGRPGGNRGMPTPSGMQVTSSAGNPAPRPGSASEGSQAGHMPASASASPNRPAGSSLGMSSNPPAAVNADTNASDRRSALGLSQAP
eukprot:jgi/Chlat1/4118/Chrsp269S03960